MSAPSQSADKGLVRITILVRKQDNITYEQFHEYWSEKHPDIWLSVAIVREKIVKYSQFHVNEALGAAYGSAMPFASYDGAAEMWAQSVEDLLAVFSDEEYLRVVVPDEQSFLKRDEAQVLVGWEEPKWLDGKRV